MVKDDKIEEAHRWLQYKPAQCTATNWI